MRVVFLGAPGAGKGTIARMFMEKQGLVQISTGDMLRQAIKEGTETGKQASAFIDKGELVPDELVLAMIEERIQKEDCRNGFILDGFPRTIPQAEGLDLLMAKIGIKLDAVVDISVDENVLIERLTSRRTCSNPECQAIYNVKSNPPKSEGVCDRCGGALVQRSDETKEVIEQRLVTYRQKTEPLMGYYSAKGGLRSVDGSKTPDEVYRTVMDALAR